MIYLVDYENVSNSGLEGIEKLTDDDKLIIFLREDNTFKAKTHLKLERTTVPKDYIFVNCNSANALDFQLVAYLGILCTEKPNEQYVIISKDQGYDAAIKFLKGRARKVSRDNNLDTCKESNSSTLSKVTKILTELNNNQRNQVANIIDKYKTKQAIINHIQKAFSAEQYNYIPEQIKPLLKDKS